MAMTEPHTIFVHCTATRPDWWEGKTAQEKTDEVRRWHVEDRGWSDIGYHFLIDRDGTVTEGRKVTRQGAHAKGHNRGTIAISLFGGHGSSENDAFEDNFTADQERVLRRKIRQLQTNFPTIKKVRGHNEVAPKACPGFQVSRFMAHKPPKKKTPANSTTLAATATTAVTGAGGVFTALARLDPTAQAIVAVCACVALLGLGWIARERLKKMVAGR